jgi:acetyl esterase/lipase
MAENFVSKDIIVVSVGYDLAPQVTLTEIINQVQNGFAEVLKYSNGFGDEIK